MVIAIADLSEIIPSNLIEPTGGWLKKLYIHDSRIQRENEDETSFHRVAAVWTLARYWSPPSGRSDEENETFITDLLSGKQEIPSNLARKWSIANAQAICALETAAMLEARDIKETLRGMYLDFQVERQNYDPQDLQAHLLDALNRRDILESFAHALTSVRSAIEEGNVSSPYFSNYLPCDGLWAEIESLDNLAAKYADFIRDNVDASEDLRCRKAGVNDPDLWWGALAYL